jgi:hypothetical protein
MKKMILGELFLVESGERIDLGGAGDAPDFGGGCSKARSMSDSIATTARARRRSGHRNGYRTARLKYLVRAPV